MMMKGLKVLALFMGYSAVGAGGDYAAGLMADEPEPPVFEYQAREVANEGEAEVRVRHSGECRFELDREVSISAHAAQWLRLEAGSGSLTVEGRQGLDEVRAVGRVCASEEAFLDDLRLTLEAVGDEVVLTAHYPDFRGWGGARTARIDLVVEVPLNMPVDVDDSSGGMELYGTGELRIDDSSGEIHVRGADGPVRIEDGSGEIFVQDVAGDVQIDDGSGEIDVRDVQGEVRIRDGSGSVTVVEVDRSVVVERDGSGSISVRNVSGDFRVDRDGSGSIRYSGIQGRVDIPRDKRER